MSERSPQYQRFMASFEGPVDSPSAMMSFDMTALAEVTDETERGLIAEALIARIEAREEDPRVVPALLEIGTGAAIAALEGALDGAHSLTNVTAAHRLWTDFNREEGRNALLAAAREATGSVRTAALKGLADVAGKDVDALLLELLDDPESLCRSTALTHLYEKHGLKPLDRVRGKLFRVTLGVMSAYPTVRARAITTLEQILVAVEDGQSPESQGLALPSDPPAEALASYIQSTRRNRGTPDPWQDHFDADAIRALSDHDRGYLEDLLVGRMHAGDLTVPSLLTAIGSEIGHVAMRDALRVDPGDDLRKAIESALTASE